MHLVCLKADLVLQHALVGMLFQCEESGAVPGTKKNQLYLHFTCLSVVQYGYIRGQWHSKTALAALLQQGLA